MQWMEMHNVEYGECIVLGGKNKEILMVDCGSMNQKIRDGDMDFSAYVSEQIANRYSWAQERNFLLTHYHRDHLCGLYQLLRINPNYFNRIYLPYTPVDRHNVPLLIDFALFVYVFLGRQSDYSQMNVSALKIFDRIGSTVGYDRIFTLKAEDIFNFDDVTYEVLWPNKENYPFTDIFANSVEDMNVCLSSPYLGENATEFLQLKNRFEEEYLNCCRVFSSQEKVDLPTREQAVAKLNAIFDKIDQLIPSVNLLPAAPDIVEILSRQITRTAYSDAVNAASIVFQNKRTTEASFDDLLMTGDATPESMDEIADKLYGGYYVLKAPHHGTASSWTHLFAEMGASHVLISNGDYHAGGSICEEYVDMPAIKHCTNNSACKWFATSGCSCNRLSCCYEQTPHQGLTIKCPAVASRIREAGCNLYIISPTGEKVCLCDNLPSIIH